MKLFNKGILPIFVLFSVFASSFAEDLQFINFMKSLDTNLEDEIVDISNSSNTTTTTAIVPTNTTTLTTSKTTSETTTAASTTVAPEPTPQIYNFTVPKNSSLPTCLRLFLAATFKLTYNAEFDKQNFTSTVNLNLQDISDYDGECATNFNSIEIKFRDAWALKFNYTLTNEVYELSGIRLDYVIDSKLFPNASKADIGSQFVEVKNLTDFSASKGNSYKCTAKTSVTLSNLVTIDISNYQAQPFSDSKSKDFDTAIDCPADTTGTSKLVPIIVGSALAVLVVLVLIAYVIGKRKHRPGYQQV